jgi:hypothetical protein
MSDATPDRGRHTIDDLGLSFDVDRAWPLETLSLTDGEMVYQRLPGEAGTFFVRYGAGQTLDAFLAGLGGGLTTVTTDGDETVSIAGHAARRVTLTSRQRAGGTYRDDGPVRERSPVVLTRIVVLGLDLDGTPVLIGYRLYEDERAAYESTLEQMLAGVTIDRPAGNASSAGTP